MGMLTNALAKLETRLQTLIEGSVARIFSNNSLRAQLSNQLFAAMRAGIQEQADGDLIAPNLYTVTLHPSQASELDRDPAPLEELASSLQTAAAEAGLVFLSPPVLRVGPDSEMPVQEIAVKAQISIDNLAETTDLVVEASPNAPLVPENAFLIVNGMRILPLILPVINIGRREDNDLVIDDRRISRVHAQLRAIKSHYVIFDLDSLGGTYVNEHQIQQCILYPGDVISLAGVPLVFGQEESQLGGTQKLTFE